jgi:hypothetical protein
MLEQQNVDVVLSFVAMKPNVGVELLWTQCACGFIETHQYRLRPAIVKIGVEGKTHLV